MNDTRKGARKLPGLGSRIAQRLNSMGYWKNGKPDISRFCQEKQYKTQNFYPWVNADRMPEYPNLQRLGRDLDVPMAWLLVGSEGLLELRRYEMRYATPGVKREQRRVDFGSG